MKQRHIILGAGVAVAAWLAVFGDTTQEDGIAQPVARAAVSAPLPRAWTEAAMPKAAKPDDASPILALEPRETLIGGARRTDKPANLFAGHNWTPPPPPVKPAPPSAPAAPPLPFKYLGKQKEADEWQVFLGRDDHTFIVRKNDVVNDIYKVVDIAPPSITLLYLPLNQSQSLTIE